MSSAKRRRPRSAPATTVVSLVHLGCARNLIDSEVILARLAEEGALISDQTEGSDVVVLNTCSFIGPAREESEHAILDLLAKKKAGAVRGVVVAGCLVQRFKHDLALRFPEVDLFAEISDYKGLAKAVTQLGRGQGVPKYLAADRPGPEREGSRLLSTPASYAYLRVSHGCDHQCSFCAIPSIRGAHRSKALDNVLAEARELIASGVKELVLVAEDLTAWGRDLSLELPVLVQALAELEGEHRLRLMYAYPNHFPWGLVPLLRDHPRVLPYLDIPIQHISTKVLRAMRRNGSGDQVRAVLDRLRQEVPGITLRTTVLVGFPGESESDVDELVEFIERYQFGRLGAFCYSPEEGTHGITLGDAASAKIAEARRTRVLAARDLALRTSQGSLVGQEVELLIDEQHATRSVGRTLADAPEVDMIAILEGRSLEVGSRLRARVEALDEEYNLLCAAPATHATGGKR